MRARAFSVNRPYGCAPVQPGVKGFAASCDKRKCPLLRRPRRQPMSALPLSAIARSCLAAAGLAAVAGAPSAALADPACSAQSAAGAPTVIELYTSEGCSSCPPADRWLSGLKGRDGVIALAFHVDYWDSLGWKDRFAQPQFTQRQNATQHTSGARFAYTPQVIVDSRDAPNWSSLGAATLQPKTPATVGLTLARDGTGLALTVAPGAGSP